MPCCGACSGALMATFLSGHSGSVDLPALPSLFTALANTTVARALAVHDAELVSNNFSSPWPRIECCSEVALVMAASGRLAHRLMPRRRSPCARGARQHVPQLEVFDVLLGDRPPLDPYVTYYQRLLARDQTKSEIVRKLSASIPARRLRPPARAVALLGRDRERATTSRTRGGVRAETTRVVMADFGPAGGKAARPPTRAGNPGCGAGPGHARCDGLSSPTCSGSSRHVGGTIRNAPSDMLQRSSSSTSSSGVRIICNLIVPPGGLSHARQCSCLLSPLSEAKILVGRWGPSETLKRTNDTERGRATIRRRRCSNAKAASRLAVGRRTGARTGQAVANR